MTQITETTNDKKATDGSVRVDRLVINLIPRSTKEYGGGSGREVYESKLFRVVHWHLHGGIKTAVDCKLHHSVEMEFDGVHDFTSDEDCFAQMTPKEILKCIKQQRKDAYKAGQESKMIEFRDCLGL